MYLLSVKKIRSILSETVVKGFTPLHVAGLKGHLQIVKYLITECDCNPNTFDSLGYTPLGYALTGKHPEILQHLMTEYKCKSAICTKLYYDALQEQSDELDFLDFQKQFPDFDVTPLQLAILWGDLETVKILCNSHSQTSLGVTQLQLLVSCACRYLDIVNFLNDECGRDPHYSHVDGLTPLHATCTDP